MNIRALLAGVVAGVGLSLARAPEGLTLIGTPAVLASDAMLFRGAMLVAIGLAWWLARWHADPRATWTMWGAALGYGAHGLLFADLAPLTSYSALAISAGVIVALTFFVLRSPADAEPPTSRPGALQLLGLALLGAGVSLASESVARPLRLLGGTSDNETVFGWMFVLAMAIGAAAFGPLMSAVRRLELAPVFATAAAALSMYGLDFLSQASDPDSYDIFISYFRWKLGLNSFWELEHGTLVHDVVVGLRAFVLGGFMLGIALHALRHRAQLAAIAIGAGLGLLAMPELVEWTARDAQDRLPELPALRVSLATSVAALGALVALTGQRSVSARVRIGAGVAVATMAGFLWVRDNPRALPLSPWEIWRVRPAIVAEIPEGIVTIELRRRMGEVVTLNRRTLTPGDTDFRTDEASIAASVGTWAGTEPIDGAVLLIGQLTPDRARLLEQLGATKIDRTGAWHMCMPDIESALFSGPAPTTGDILSPTEARARMGEYALIVSPATRPQGLLTTDAWLRPEPNGARKVAWFRLDQPHSSLDWGDQVLLAGFDFKNSVVGVIDTGARRAGWSTQSELVPAGPPSAPGIPWRRLCTRKFEREMRELARGGERVGAGARGTPFALLGEAIASLTGAQVRSTMWEEDAQSTELDERGMEKLASAARDQLAQGAVHPFVRTLVEYVSVTLVGKREVEWVYEYLEPIRDASVGWTAVERAVAHADWEMLEFDAVAERLAPLIAAEPYNTEFLQWRALALLHAGRPGEAVELFEKLLELAPGQYAYERQLAIALVRAEDARGRELVERLLGQHPEDEVLERYLLPGPLPELEPPPPAGDIGMDHAADH